MIYVIGIILVATVILQFFTIRAWKKNAHDCMRRYDDCFIHFKKSVELCDVIQNEMNELIEINRALNNYNKILMSRLDKEESKND